MMQAVLFVAVGLVAGVLSGMLGIGGGIIVVPALVLLFGYSQHLAQGTTLAMMIPPIGILAVWTYWRQNHVSIPAAAWMCVGFALGGLLGAEAAAHVPAPLLRRLFGFVFLVVALRMIIFK